MSHNALENVAFGVGVQGVRVSLVLSSLEVTVLTRKTELTSNLEQAS